MRKKLKDAKRRNRPRRSFIESAQSQFAKRGALSLSRRSRDAAQRCKGTLCTPATRRQTVSLCGSTWLYLVQQQDRRRGEESKRSVYT